MCLEEVKKFKVPTGIGMGYKKFRYREVVEKPATLFKKAVTRIARLSGMIMGGPEIPSGMWLYEKEFRTEDAVKETIKACDKKNYLKGFHIYLEPGDGRELVFFRDVVATGYQDYEAVVIAKEIFCVNQ